MPRNKDKHLNRTQRRANAKPKRGMVTRRKAQALIAASTDPDFIREFESHQSAHIRAYAAHKLARLMQEEAA